MGRLSIDVSSYYQITGALRVQVREAIELLERGLEGGAIPEHGGALTDLAEGAALVGAERVENLLRSLATAPDTRDAEQLVSGYQLLLWELKKLHQALPYPPEVAA